MNPLLTAGRGFLHALRLCLLLAICLGPALTPAPPGANAAAEQPQALPPTWSVLLAEGFESEPRAVNCKVTGDPTWDRADYRTLDGDWSAYGASGGSKGVPPPGPYPGKVNAWFICGPFDLSQATAAELSFSYWTGLGLESDSLFWGLSTTGFLFKGDSQQGYSNGWRQVVLDLASTGFLYLGQPQVWIGFRFQSDADGSGEGAYLDDITLRAQRPPDLSVRAYLPLVLGAD